MEETYLGRTRYQWLQEFSGRMHQLPYDSEDYKKCEKIFAWLANKIRLEQKVEIESYK